MMNPYADFYKLINLSIKFNHMVDNDIDTLVEVAKIHGIDKAREMVPYMIQSWAHLAEAEGISPDLTMTADARLKSLMGTAG